MSWGMYNDSRSVQTDAVAGWMNPKVARVTLQVTLKVWCQSNLDTKIDTSIRAWVNQSPATASHPSIRSQYP